jgi:hypothetical protein
MLKIFSKLNWTSIPISEFSYTKISSSLIWILERNSFLSLPFHAKSMSPWLGNHLNFLLVVVKLLIRWIRVALLLANVDLLLTIHHNLFPFHIISKIVAARIDPNLFQLALVLVRRFEKVHKQRKLRVLRTIGGQQNARLVREIRHNLVGQLRLEVVEGVDL